MNQLNTFFRDDIRKLDLEKEYGDAYIAAVKVGKIPILFTKVTIPFFSIICQPDNIFVGLIVDLDQIYAYTRTLCRCVITKMVVNSSEFNKLSEEFKGYVMDIIPDFYIISTNSLESFINQELIEGEKYCVMGNVANELDAIIKKEINSFDRTITLYDKY